MRLTVTALLVCAFALPGATSVVAHADPAPLPVLTLTTIPEGWSLRTDLRPVLKVYSDGSALRSPDATSKDRKPDTAPKEEKGTVAADVIAAATDEIVALKDVDMGIPVGDGKGTQIVDLMPSDAAGEVHLIVYSPNSTDGLNPDQTAARKRFTEVYRKLVEAFTA
ncbi:hypothetical protein [Nocardia camponoti]|uniref:DUF1795 domain-containing protein n=1 Tax=Nocardia camponoti TaxID=1616106 RepID=A0A917QAN3_9NOCA|nr:hypothetical protein [Nocardia camponoti]GGK39621.1 hypothetical protein GCM10011591_09160 [Nocardia camponoti]